MLGRRVRVDVAVAVFGAMSIAVLWWSGRLSERLTAEAFLVEDLVREIEVKVAVSHLWLEEYLSGDSDIPIDQRLTALEQADDYLQILLTGGLHGGMPLDALGSTTLRASVLQARRHLGELRRLSSERRHMGASAGAGSDLDQRYDEVFHILLEEIESLHTALGERRAGHRTEARWRLGVLMAAWSLLVAAASFGLWTQERRRRASDQALAQREAELREAQKMEAVGRLAGGIAHDINNYLGAIRGYCEVAKMKGESGPALERRMDDAIETTESVSALIRQLLAFSRRRPVEAEVVDINRVASNLESMLGRLLGEDVEWVGRFADDLQPVEIDPSQVEQILVNLLVNARDAMPRGGRVTVTTRNLEVNAMDERRHAVAAGSYVLLEVTDTGTGIPQAVREKIFEPFFTTKSGEHSGLGLATVYGAARQNGGFVVVESAEGRGTTFKVLLPASSASLSNVSRAPVRRPAPGGREGLRVLLVEDNPAMRGATRDLLEQLGHRVETASDGEEALERLRDDPDLEVDLLLTDVVLPGISGRELVDRLRTERREARCLFMSGYTDQVALRHGLDTEHVDFLAKPFGADALAEKIGEIFPAS